jgi:hypothetical protein
MEQRIHASLTTSKKMQQNNRHYGHLKAWTATFEAELLRRFSGIDGVSMAIYAQAKRTANGYVLA